MDCYYCGREVRETTHTQKHYKVDYYLQHTGKTEWAFFTSLKEDTPTIRYLKLIHPIDIITCVQCYIQPEIRRCLDDDFVGDKSPPTFDQGPNHTAEINSKG